MSWAGIGRFLSGKWVREQSPLVVVLILLLIMGYEATFNVLPSVLERIESKAEQAYERQEKHHEEQLNRVSTSFDGAVKAFAESAKDTNQLLRSVIQGRVSAEKDQSDAKNLSSVGPSEPECDESP